GGEQHAGLHQLFVVLAHRGHQLLARHHAGFGVLVGFDDHHETHDLVSLAVAVRRAWGSGRSGPSLVPGSTVTTNAVARDRHAGEVFFWGAGRRMLQGPRVGSANSVWTESYCTGSVVAEAPRLRLLAFDGAFCSASADLRPSVRRLQPTLALHVEP